MALISIAISLLVITSGIFLLAKVKKEELGVKYKVAGYGITLSGFVLVILSICFSIVMIMHHGHGNYNKKCHGSITKSHCKYSGKKQKCGKKSSCDAKSGATKSCSKSSKCEKSGAEGKHKIIKKVIKNENGEEDINVEVIVE